MTSEEINNLVKKYFEIEGYQFPTDFEHRLDPKSSAILYSFIREFRPRNALEIGTWLGGSTCVIMAALLKNKNPFTFISSEIDDSLREKTFKNVFTKCGVTPIMVGDITKSLEFIPSEIDFMFVDTNHDRKTTEWIANNLWSRLTPKALYTMHDWAVKEVDGKLVGKGHEGAGATDETVFLMELYQKNEFPFEKIHWSHEYGGEELALWKKVL